MKAGTYKYFATAGANKVVCAGPAILHRIIIGIDVGSAVVEVSDHESDGDGDVKIQLNGNTLHTTTSGVVEVNAHFHKGITADLTNQTQVTFVFSPDF